MSDPTFEYAVVNEFGEPLVGECFDVDGNVTVQKWMSDDGTIRVIETPQIGVTVAEAEQSPPPQIYSEAIRPQEGSPMRHER